MSIPATLSRAEAEERLRKIPRLTETHIRCVLDRARELTAVEPPIERLPAEYQDAAREVRAIVAAHAAYLAITGAS